MTYFLQLGTPDTSINGSAPRQFIDDRIHDGCQVLDSCEAGTWKEAPRVPVRDSDCRAAALISFFRRLFVLAADPAQEALVE